MLDYFTIYKCVLQVIHDEHIHDAFELFDYLSDKDELTEMRSIFPKKIMIEATLEVLDNLIDDRLIVAKRYPTKDVTLYQIDRLSTAGHGYLLQLQEPSLKKKTIKYLKDNGIPLTPQSISKAIINCIY